MSVKKNVTFYLTECPNQIVVQFPVYTNKQITGEKHRNLSDLMRNHNTATLRIVDAASNQFSRDNDEKCREENPDDDYIRPKDFTLLRQNKFRELKSIASKTDHDRKSLGKKFLYKVENYCDKTTLHGLRYVGDNSISVFERIFWLIAFALAIIFATYYIANIYKKWNSNPVIISISPFDVNLKYFPFPAVTLCNMNQAKKYEANRIIHEGTDDEKKLLDISCKTNSLNYSNNVAPKWETIKDFMLIVGQSCTDMLKECRWKNSLVPCDIFFANYLTDEGICCSFNRVPPKYLFRNANDIPILNQSFPENVYDWSPQHGFADNYNESYTPRRPLGAGTHMGLTVILDAEVDNYYCSSTYSTGFKVHLSNPIEHSKIAEFGSLISPGEEIRYELYPEITRATPELKTVSIENRQCFFPEERLLFYFRTYTQKNCQMECLSNYTYQMCGCIPYYLPRSHQMKICGVFENNCVAQANENMNLVNGNGTNCNCLTSCYQMNFMKKVSSSKLSANENKLNVSSGDYFVKNMAVLHFFFEKSKYRIQIKNELYGFTEILSNIGGLLGLFMGFSFLSLVELFYYLSVRICCEIIQTKRKKQGKIQNNKINNYNKSNPSTVYPFIN